LIFHDFGLYLSQCVATLIEGFSTVIYLDFKTPVDVKHEDGIAIENMKIFGLNSLNTNNIYIYYFVLLNLY